MLTFKFGCEGPKSTQLANGGAGSGAEISNPRVMLCRNAHLVQVAFEVYARLHIFNSVTLIFKFGQPSTH